MAYNYRNTSINNYFCLGELRSPLPINTNLLEKNIKAIFFKNNPLIKIFRVGFHAPEGTIVEIDNKDFIIGKTHTLEFQHLSQDPENGAISSIKIKEDPGDIIITFFGH